jgi:class 3 adenylate cyclase
VTVVVGNEVEQSQSFAVLLKDYRVAAALTQEGLAERAGVSTRTVSDLERGLYQAPHRDTVARLVEALELTPQQQANLEAAISRYRGPLTQPVQPEPAATAARLPTGMLTLLLIEIDGAARVAAHYPTQLRPAVAEYDRIARSCFSKRNGVLVNQPGAAEGRLGVFQLASEAVAAAAELQQTLHAQPWSAGLPLRVRLALYTGETDLREGVYYGNAVSRCTSLRAMAAGGQSLMSESVWALTRAALPPDVEVRDLGEHQLSEHGRPERIVELIPAGVPSDFPPLGASMVGHYDTVLRGLQEGRVVLFAGDGINLTGRTTTGAWRPRESSDLPASTELASALAASFGYTAPAPAELTRVAQYIATLVGSGPLYDVLHEMLDADYRPTAVHEFMAQLPAALAQRGPVARAPLIVTTSYDQGLEIAFAKAGEPVDVVTYISDGHGQGRFVHRLPDGRIRPIEKPNKYLGLPDSRTTIVKVHGAVDRVNPDQDSFVITEDHFLDFMTGGDIANLVPVTIAARFRRSHFLFLGYSLRDWNLRVILHRMWGEQRPTYKSWSIHASRPEAMEHGLWRERGVDVLDLGLAEYIAGLQERLLARAAEGRPR